MVQSDEGRDGEKRDEEREFVEQARRRILNHARKRREAGYTDKLYAVVRSESGDLHDGIPFETSMPHFNFCAERHAIHEFGDDATVYCTTFVREDDGWTTFPELERYTATELYPGHRPHPKWD